MKHAFCILLVSGLAAYGATEERLHRTFVVQPGGTLVIDVEFGALDVSTNAGTEVVVDVYRKIGRGSAKAEKEYLAAHPVEFSQEGSTVSVQCKSGQGSGWSFFGRNQNEAKYTVTVPSKFNARLTTAGGGIQVRDLTGDTRARTSGGGLRFERLRGEVDGQTSGGGIDVADCTGGIKIRTSGGGIRAENGGGSLDGETSGGAVTVKTFQGPARVSTSGGGMTLERIGGTLHGSTSGGGIQAVVEAPVPGEVKLSTSGGGVTVRIPENAAFELDAATSAGNVSSELPVTTVGKAERSRLKGPVNGGGPTVHLRTAGGGIRIEKL